MAGNTFYTRNSRKRSKASNTHRSQDNKNDLPGLAYLQGHSIRDIFVPRGMLPVIGRDGYKTIITTRFSDGSAKNRTISQTEDTKSNDYFVDSDRFIPSKFVISQTFEKITTANFTDKIDGIIFPNGSRATLNELDVVVIGNLISHLVSKQANFADKVILPDNLKSSPVFRGYSNIRFMFVDDFKPEANVTFPDGGITQVPNFQVFTKVYGHNSDHSQITPYTDLQKFDPIEWIRGSGPKGMYPDVTPSRSYDDSLFNGIIEPFNIRSEVYDSEIFGKNDEVKPNSVAGRMMHDIKGYCSLQETLNAGSGEYEDAGLSGDAASLLETEFVKFEEFISDPFLEKDRFLNNFIDDELKAAIGINNLSPGYIPDGSIVFSTGFDGFGHDKVNSLLYRGRLR